MAENVQYWEEIVPLRRAFGMLLLKTESPVSERGCKGTRSVSNPEQWKCTMNFGFIWSIITEPLSCARIEVRKDDLRTIDWLLGERSINEHGGVRAWARRRVA